LINGEIVEENDLGSIRRVTVDTLPILSGMSIKRIVVNPGAMRTPHWQADCNELTYCVSGTSLVSVLDTYSKFSSFTVSAGEMFHIDSGSLHHIENIGDEPAEFILAFRSERPEDFGLAAAFGALTDAVLGNTYDLPAGGDRGRIGTPCAPAVLARAEGSVDVLAAHPRGRHARTTLAPDHRRDGLCPRRFGPSFFDQPTPGDIGYRASASAYSREVLAATFNVQIDDLPEFPFTKVDPLIVTRNNPVDEHAMGE
jgi:mannose-6-phosphate isomerase-like protein (cupin superfamily)